jgi:hypothetical protein
MKQFPILFAVFILNLLLGCKNNSSEYRDLNKNGKKDIYEDSTASIDKRVEEFIVSNDIGRKSRHDVYRRRTGK